MKTLLLWDIDCTLIDSGGAGERALRFAAERMLGAKDDLQWLEYFGRTDRWIARSILAKHRGPSSEEDVDRFLGHYLAALVEEVHNPRGRVLPGIREILSIVSERSDMVQGLLTGNLRRGAEIKLGHFGLWSYFPFGAFAEDSEERNELGPHAVRRACAHHAAEFHADKVIVIGDTPHDIACGKAIGARTIAVATGRYSPERLRAERPHALFETLAETQAFFRSVTESGPAQIPPIHPAS